MKEEKQRQQSIHKKLRALISIKKQGAHGGGSARLGNMDIVQPKYLIVDGLIQVVRVLTQEGMVCVPLCG